jgi:Rrf2 family transcriptional regulator, iron-sulfur cluster assembly transcription factor
MFSKACEYSIKAAIFLAMCSEDKKRARLPEIAEAIKSPEAFTAKLLQQLVKKNILWSIKGPHGGFELAKDGDETTLYEIVEAVDGDQLFVGCALGLKNCSETHPCPVHNKFKAIRDHLTGVLHTTTLKEAAGSVHEGESFLSGLT